MKPRVLNILPDTFFTILERSSATFLGFSLEPLYYESLEMPNRVAQILLLADMLPYVAIVFIVAMIGSQYSTDHALLTQRTVYAGSFFCYGSILLNFMALVYGNEILLTHKLLIFSGLYQFSFATQVFKVMLLLILGALYSLLHVNVGEQLRSLELPLLIQITVALCITVLSANNFALILLALEGFSLTLYIMTALARSYGGITASVKYFAFGTLGSIFLFWGAVHLYATTGTLSVDILEIFLRLSSENTAFLSTNFATTAIALGFLLKIGAAPTHQWVADTYAGVHMYITAYFSVFVKCLLFLIFLKIAVHFNCDALAAQFSIISLAVGCFMSINQSEIKRLLAYSSIVHVGFLLMGDTASSLVYLTTYILSSLAIFAVLLNAEVAGSEIIYFNDLRYIRGSYLNTATLVVAMASSAGLPPFAGFYGKFLVWTSLIEDIYLSNSLSAYLTLFFSVAITLVTIFYYMRVVAYLFVGHDAQNFMAHPVLPARSDFLVYLFSLRGLLTAALIFWTFMQSYIVDLVHLVSATL